MPRMSAEERYAEQKRREELLNKKHQELARAKRRLRRTETAIKISDGDWLQDSGIKGSPLELRITKIAETLAAKNDEMLVARVERLVGRDSSSIEEAAE